MSFQFFLPMVPPTVTQQEHAIRVVKGKPVVYDPPELKLARGKFMALLGRERQRLDMSVIGEPMFPLEGPIRLTTKWIWPTEGEHGDGAWRTTKPDTDNLIKLFKDCMTRVGFWVDDAQVCSEITEKFWGAQPGIFVRVEAL